MKRRPPRVLLAWLILTTSISAVSLAADSPSLRSLTELDVSIDTKKELGAELDRQVSVYGKVASIAARTPNFRGFKFWGLSTGPPGGR